LIKNIFFDNLYCETIEHYGTDKTITEN